MQIPFPIARLEQFIDTAEKRMLVFGIGTAEVCSLWDWLGNVKYKNDDGNLTVERAGEIVEKMPELVREWRDSSIR